MSASRLFLTGIRASGRHGASPGEKDRPQEFVVDLDVEVDVDRDDLESTADYRGLVEAARRTVADESFDLLETLAGAVARAVLHVERVRRVRVVVHKPTAAASVEIAGVAAASEGEGPREG